MNNVFSRVGVYRDAVEELFFISKFLDVRYLE